VIIERFVSIYKEERFRGAWNTAISHKCLFMHFTWLYYYISSWGYADKGNDYWYQNPYIQAIPSSTFSPKNELGANINLRGRLQLKTFVAKCKNFSRTANLPLRRTLVSFLNLLKWHKNVVGG